MDKILAQTGCSYKNCGMVMLERDRILVIRPDRIGDLILTLPLIESLKLNEEDSEVWTIVRNYSAPVLHNNPNVDRIVQLDDFEYKKIRKLVKTLDGVEFSKSISLTSDLPSVIIPLLLNVHTRVGPGNRMVSVFYNKRVTLKRTESGLHETLLNLKYLIPIGYKPLIKQPHLYLKAGEIERVKNILSDIGYKDTEPLVVIHPGSGGSSRLLPVEKYLEVAKSLSNNAFIVITGLPHRDPIRAFEGYEDRNIYLWEEKNLRLLMALLDIADLYIGGDTGPMHIASALNTPVLAIFSPIESCSPDRWGPLSDLREVIVPEVSSCENDCSRCEYFDCMERIEVDIIYEKSLDMLKEDRDGF